MISILNKEVEYKELSDKLFEYVNYQSQYGFPFGELVIVHYKMFEGQDTDEIYTIAAAIELLILASNILDDVQDNDTENKPWSKETALALNCVVILLFICIQAVRETNICYKEKVISLILEFGKKSIYGQYKDILKNCLKEEEYIKMSLEKSGSLVALSCLIGTVLATGTIIKEVETYSMYLGLIEQIENDLMDIQSLTSKNDILNKKLSLPIIFLLRNSDKSVQFIHKYYENNVDFIEFDNYKENVLKKFHDVGVIAYTKVIREIYRKKVLNELDKIQFKNEYLEQLKTLV